MWFLIKSTVFLCFTLVVLSFFSSDDQSEKSLSVAGVTNAVLSAGEIVHYMSGICVEKPDVCVKGAETLSLLSERTREGAKVAFQLLEGQLGDTKTTNQPPVQTEVASKQAELEPDSNIHTGTIAAPAPAPTVASTKLAANVAPQLTRIPVPMKRPANL